MREILFRGKSKGKPEWVYGSLYKEGTQVFILVGGRFYPEPSNGQSALGIMDWYEVFPDSIGQFTGLHDKHGVEIYEGDIVIHQFGVGYSSKMYASFADGTQKKQTKTIVWNKIYCGYDFLSPPYDDEWLQDFEVIGNIHDNPELQLEEQEQ